MFLGYAVSFYDLVKQNFHITSLCIVFTFRNFYVSLSLVNNQKKKKRFHWSKCAWKQTNFLLREMFWHAAGTSNIQKSPLVYFDWCLSTCCTPIYSFLIVGSVYAFIRYNLHKQGLPFMHIISTIYTMLGIKVLSYLDQLDFRRVWIWEWRLQFIKNANLSLASIIALGSPKCLVDVGTSF